MMRFQRAKTLLAGIALAAGWVVALPAPAAASLFGNVWSSLDSGSSAALWDIACPGSSTCYAVGDSGTVLVTRNGGASWSSLPAPTANSLQGISCPAALTCYAVGPAPVALKTTDGGNTWSDISAGVTQAVLHIACPDPATCWAVGAGGSIFDTKDGGATWRAEGIRTRASLSGVSCPSTATCFVVGEETIEKTADGGNSWYGLDPRVPYRAHSVSCSSETHCVTVGLPPLGGSGVALTTADGGTSWVFHEVPNVALAVTCAGSRCLATGYLGSVVTSNDGGTTWAPDVQSNSTPLQGIACLSASVCFAVGGAGTLLASPDGPRTVTNANDSGAGSFRAAINFANGHPGLDTITFGIGSGPASIALQTPLPFLSDYVAVDATTQPGYAGSPIVELNGASAGQGARGLVLTAGDSRILGFVINRFDREGIYLAGQGRDLITGNFIGTNIAGTAALGNGTDGVFIEGTSGNCICGFAARNVISGNHLDGVGIDHGTDNFVQANFIGTDVNGTVALGNGRIGVYLPFANHNIIGGSDPGAGNLISGNPTDGVNIGGDSNWVQGNYIGTDVTGTHAIGNDTGVFLYQGANNLVGGLLSGARNVISGNRFSGINIGGERGVHNTVLNNFIGTDATGTHPLGNQFGITVFMGLNQIGGDFPGFGNVISGNLRDGVVLNHSGGNVVQGNFIGTDYTGTSAVPNNSAAVAAGISLFGGFNNLIGGTTPDARNVISGNQFSGIDVFDGSYGNRIEGNYIGTDVTGTHPLGNQDGVRTYSVSGNFLGGADAGAGNVISGNRRIGVILEGPGGTTLQGNYIGTDRNGTARLPNALSGLVLDNSSGNTMYRNVVSGNDLSGVELSGAGSSNNILQGNLVGTDPTGTAAVPNALFGVYMNDGASHNTIGGTAAGAGNVISGNQSIGLAMFDLNTTPNAVVGNFVGVDASGSHALPNGGPGLLLGSGGNLIGGPGPAQRNVLSGNEGAGIAVFGGAVGNTIQGNYVGTDATGTTAIANLGPGIELGDAPSTLVLGNVLSGNGFSGINLGGDTSHVTVQGNFIGTDSTGSRALGNANSGVTIFDGTDIQIGGTSAAARNVISGNGDCGVNMFGTNSSRNVIQGNYIGTDVSGTGTLGNNNIGVQIFDGVGNTIGGASDGAGNVISGNLGTGVQINNSQGTNFIQGNFIGTDRTGSASLGNGAAGIWIGFASRTLIGGATVSSGNTIVGNVVGIVLFGDTATDNFVQGNYIGTNTAGAVLPNPGNGVIIDAGASRNTFTGNVVANNDFNGIVVWSGVRNTIRANNIYSNGAMGIDLNNDGVTLNDRGDRDGGANNSQNFPVLSRVVGTPANLVIEGSIDTPNPQTVTIEIYANASPDPGADYTGYGEGQTLIGTVKPNAAGRFSVVLPAVPKGTVISATATDAQGNTSEFALDRTT